MSERLTIDDLNKSVIFKKDGATTNAYEFNLQTGEIIVNSVSPTEVSFSGTQYCSSVKCNDCTTVDCTTVQCTTVDCTTVRCRTIKCKGHCTSNCLNCSDANPSNFDYKSTQCSYTQCYDCTNTK